MPSLVLTFEGFGGFDEDKHSEVLTNHIIVSNSIIILNFFYFQSQELENLIQAKLYTFYHFNYVKY